jgi:hypothetical protein
MSEKAGLSIASLIIISINDAHLWVKPLIKTLSSLNKFAIPK